MSSFGETIIVSADQEEALSLTALLNMIEVSRIRHFESTMKTWSYLSSARYKSSINLLFLDARDVNLAYELLMKIMASESLSHIQVVAIANSEPKDLMLLFQRGAVGLITKPFTLQKVATFFDRQPGKLKKSSVGNE